MRHEELWRAIDTLAAERGLSTSGLARAAGLDPTSFNPSKRRARNGMPRWPSTESIAKILAATSISLDNFAALVAGARALGPRMAEARPRKIPVIGVAQAGQDGYFDDSGYPVGGSWEQVDLPQNADANAYGLRISGNSMEPVYRAGDIVIVAPHATARIGDRVIARTRAGEVMAKILTRRTATDIDLASFNPEHPTRRIALADLAALHRIMWASQ